jgi:hypothetical protein
MPNESVSALLKAQVIQRAKGCCEYCQSQASFSPQPFSIEHILPVSKGGHSTLDNLALSCQGCNNHKYIQTHGIDPITGYEVALFHPREDDWHRHFAWSSDYSLMIGLSPTGRATIDTLRLNRDGVKNLRQLLITAGKHPP